MATEALMDLTAVADYLGVSESTARRLANEAGFPNRYRLSGRCVRWRRSELDRWLSGRAEAPIAVPERIAPELLISRPRGPRRKAA